MKQAATVQTNGPALTLEFSAFLDRKAFEINQARGLACVRIGSILLEVKQAVKDGGDFWLPFLSRPDVAISEDKAQRYMIVAKAFRGANEDNLVDFEFSKLVQIASLNDEKVRALVLADPIIKAELESATTKQIAAVKSDLNDRISKKDLAIEDLRAQIVAAKNAGKETDKAAKAAESERVKVLEKQLNDTKSELAKALNVGEKQDVDAIKIYQKAADTANAQLKALAGQYEKSNKELAEMRLKIRKLEESNADSDSLNAEIDNLEKTVAQLKTELDKKCETIADLKVSALHRPAVDVPSFDFTLDDCVNFLNSEKLFDKFLNWFEAKTATVQANNN